jgi:hypothetical protein
MRQAVKVALVAATFIAPAEALSATITVHEPDGEGRVFVDVVGKIDEGDFETFKEKTDKIYAIGASHPKKLVIVTLMSYGGLIAPAMQIGEWVRKRGMLTFVPGDRTCASSCALIWVAGWLRTVGDTPQIGFHAAYDEDSGRESGAGNAVMGAYLRDLGFGYKAIHLMTHKGPTSLEWLTPDLAKEVEVAWLMLQPPRAIPLPPQQRGLHPPLQVIEAWSRVMPRPVTVSPERRNETVVVRRPIHVPQLPEEVRELGARQNAVLYEEDPADPNGKRFVGSAIWRTEMVTPGPGQPPELAIRADIEVPERKLAMTWSLRRNTDKGLPATHTVEIMFKLPSDFPAGGISNVPGMLMKQAEQTRGVPLAGLAVKVTPGFYMIGLSNMDADKERNIPLLKERAWFDIPVVYSNNRRAILAVEKGTPGERAFVDAFKALKQ